jgi:uncharacterized membrane protein
MKTLIPAVVLLMLYLCFMCCVILSDAQLPDRMATHFDINGQPDGWASRSSYMLFIVSFGTGIALFIVFVGFAIRFAPNELISLQNREYWLALERRAETMAYIFRQMIWFTCWWECFVIGVHLSIIDANNRVPVQLPNWEIYGLLAIFLAGIPVWILIMMRHFKRTI